VICIHVPPLRERAEDIPLLAQYFLERYSKETNKNIDSISREAMDLLNRYYWYGNVRELQNAIERAVVLCKKRQIGVSDLAFLQAGATEPAITQSLDQITKNHIQRVLKSCDWNISKAADSLGIHRSTLHKKIREYDMKPDSTESS
jgi:DNA-binding NtrC family response regulator